MSLSKWDGNAHHSAAAVAAGISFASQAPSAAHADFIYNLSVINIFTGSGSISFDALSGSDSDFTNTDGVSAFISRRRGRRVTSGL